MERTSSTVSSSPSASATVEQISQQDAMIKLLAPDGYYAYLGVEKVRVEEAAGGATGSVPVYSVDEDAVKKSYRKLSRRHHPDKGGDENTFRLLNRAQRVLLHPKLRAQYDNLGIDLDDEEHDDTDANFDHESSDNADASKKNQNDQGNGISQGIISELASMALTGIIQLAIRTLLMGLVAVVVTKYRWTAYPAFLFMGYIVFQVVGKASIRGGSVYDSGGVSMYDAMSPFLILVGLIFMFGGRSETYDWSWTFWIGESLVLALFTYNSVSSIAWNNNLLALGGLGLGAGVAALLFRGKLYHYLAVIVLELVVAILVAMAFPIMELLLETILNEKLKKVGEKVRAHHRQLEHYYQAKYNEQSSSTSS